MKIIVVSDIHSAITEFTRAIKHLAHTNYPDGIADVLAILGDTFPMQYSGERNTATGLEQWLLTLPAKKVLYVPGNHDIPLDESWEPVNDKVVNMIYGGSRAVEIDGVTFAGFGMCACYNAPYLKQYWSRMTDDDGVIKAYVRGIPKHDVLLSHSPPYGILDFAHNESLGVPKLAEKCVAQGARVIVCGHIHEHGGEEYSAPHDGGMLKVYNVALTAKVIEV